MLSIFYFFCIYILLLMCSFFFFFNDTATTEIYTLSLHDALPIWEYLEARRTSEEKSLLSKLSKHLESYDVMVTWNGRSRSEEHTSELQSPCNLVCRLLLEKKKKKRTKRKIPKTKQI